jgi:hypothetical protein
MLKSNALKDGAAQGSENSTKISLAAFCLKTLPMCQRFELMVYFFLVKYKSHSVSDRPADVVDVVYVNL